jgi:hypothetical protein
MPHTVRAVELSVALTEHEQRMGIANTARREAIAIGAGIIGVDADDVQSVPETGRLADGTIVVHVCTKTTGCMKHRPRPTRNA